MKINKEGLEAFLASPYLKGIGRVFAGRISETIGVDILSPEFDFSRLNSVKGFPLGKIDDVKAGFKALRFEPSVAVALYSAGLKDAEVEKIMSHYGVKAEAAIHQDPYDMVENVWKVSFFTADKVGKWLGLPMDDPRRIRGALLTAVKFYAERGSLFAGEESAIKTGASLAGVDPGLVAPQLEELVAQERLIRSMEGIYLPVYYKAEEETARKLARLVDTGAPPEVIYPLATTDMDGNRLNPDQTKALETVMNNPVTIITGGPGTGKTTVVRGIVKLFEDMERNVVLVAPTGRAAKRLSDLAGSEAKTIHRLLGYSMGRGYRKKRVDAGILVIDEASMLEQVIFSHLLDAVGPDTKIVLVGDTNQLPAIGAGNVLDDLIQSGRIPVVRMTENFRQKAGSHIAATAEGIRNGEAPTVCNAKDFMLVTVKSHKEILSTVLKMVSDTIPADFAIDPKDIQVVSPQQDGPLGARELNIEIQNRVNSSGPALKSGKKTLRLGDRVMQTANSSDRNVYNGETGWISDVDEGLGFLEVTFADGKTLRYDKKQLRELSLAYATTVHKLQGSETDYMVMILSGIHKNLLYRNLLYTAVSRARKLCVLIGEEKAIRTALRNETVSTRNSNLSRRLIQSSESPF